MVRGSQLRCGTGGAVHGAVRGYNSSSTAAAREKRSGAGGGLQESGRLVWLSFVSILELMFGATVSYVVSLNVHAACCVGSGCNSFWHASTEHGIATS
jgi:hypothetical protein